MFHQFPYRAFDRVRDNGVLEQVLRPTVDFTVSYGDNAGWSEDALIDTGSPETLFSHEIGQAISIPFLAPGSEYDSFRMLGHLQVAQKARVSLSLNKFPDIRWETDAWFFVEDWDWSLNVGAVFGTHGFLEQWAVTFVKSEDYFVVEDLDGFRTRTPPDVDDLTLARHDQDWWRPGLH